MSGNPWSEKQVSELTRLLKTTMTAPEIAAHLGRTRYAVYAKAQSLGINRENGWHTRRPGVFAPRHARGELWTKQDNDKLRRMYKTPMTVAEIAEELGRSHQAVSLHAPAIGLYREPDWRSKRAEFRRQAK